MPGKAMLRQVLRGAAGAAGPVRGRLGPNVGRRPAVGAGRAAAIGGGGGYPPTVAAGAAGTMPARRTLAAAAADGGRGKGGAKEDKAATGGAAAAAKLNALTMAIKRIEHLHGKGSLMRFGDKNAQFPQVEVISTGSLALDHALGTGGLPRGRVVEMYGPESSGKTTVALHVIAEAQKMGGTCVFIDAEHALDPGYARRLGVDVDNLYISQPDNGEQGLDIAETLIKSGTVDCVVVDSVAALVPKAELDGDIGDHHIALQARLMSQALRKLTGTISKTKCLLIFINQIRQKVGVIFGSNEVTTGGTALRFYSSVRLEIRRGQKLRAEGEDVGARTKVKVVKNKLAPPFAVAEFDMLFGSGVDRRGEVLDLGVQLGLVAKSGAWFSLGELAPASLRGGEGEEAGDGEEAAEAAAAVKAVGEWPLMMGQGREKSKAFLEEHPGIYKALARAVRAKLRTMEPYAAHASSTFHEEEEEEEEKKKKKKTAAAAGASAAAEEEDDLEHENAREGAFASPTPVEEEGAPAAEEDGKKAGKGKRRTRGASASKGATVAAAEAVVPEPTPVEHFGMGAGGGVDLEIDYVSGDVRNEAALKQAAAAEGGAASS